MRSSRLTDTQYLRVYVRQLRQKIRYIGPPIEARPPSEIRRLARGRHYLL